MLKSAWALHNVSGDALLPWQDVSHDEDPPVAVVIDDVSAGGASQGVQPFWVLLQHSAAEVNGK